MTITRVQYKHAYPSSSAAFTSNVTAGNMIIVWVTGGDGTSSDATCSDSLGNTYTKIVQVKQSRSNSALYYAYNISGGSCTVSCTAGTGDYGFTAVEYSSSAGSFSSDPLDVWTSGTTTTGSEPSPITLSITTTATGFLFFGWGDELLNKHTGWTAGLTQIQKDNGHYDGTAEALNTSANTYTEGFTISGGSSSSTFAFVGFKEPSSGGSSIKTVGGLAVASVKTVGGLTFSSVKTIGGLA